jgi:hypothetical protein
MKGRDRGQKWYNSDICWEGLRKTTKELIVGNRSPGHDLNPGRSEYELGVLKYRLRCSVSLLAAQANNQTRKEVSVP